MDSRKIFLLVGALVVAAVTAFLARTLIAGSGAPQSAAQTAPGAPPPVASGVQVLVATKALPVGTILDATSVKFQPWPAEMVEGAYYVQGKFDPKAVQGTVVRTTITAGQPVTQGALVKPGDRGFLAAALTPGMRAVTIPIKGDSGVAGFVFPGDHVDLVLSQSVAGGGDGPPLTVSETIVKNLRVLAADQRTSSETDPEGKTIVHPFAMVTVEVTPALAEKISVARTISGGSLSLVLRPLADSASELDQAIADGSVKVPDGKDPKAERAMIDQAEGQPSAGRTSFATGADVSRFQRRTVPGKPADTSAMHAGGAGGNAYPGGVPAGPTVRIARGNNVTEVAVGGKK